MKELSVLAAGREAPEHPALVVAGREILYGELAERVTGRLDRVREATGKSEVVALLGTADLATLETLYALFELGVAAALVHPRLQPVEVSRLLSRLGLERLLPVPPDAGRAAPQATGLASAAPETPLAVVFTSGTTAEPRGVVLSRRAFVASARASALNLGWHADDRWLLGLPIAHVGGLGVVTRCLIARRTVVIPEELARGGSLGALGLARALGEHGTTLSSLVPTQLEWLLAREPAWAPAPQLRAVLLGGAAARPALLARAAARNVPVLTTYGLTEACSQVTTQPLGTVNQGELGAGRPLVGTEVRLEDGIICVRGPTLLSGFLPAEPGAAALSPDGWLRTTDLGRIDERGNLFVLGRVSEQIITGGENVSPAEVEAVLEQHPGVAAACVFGVPDPVWGQTVAAALVPSGTEPLDLGDLATFVSRQLAPYRRPRQVALLEALPTAASGKLDRGATAGLARASLVRLDGL